MQIESGSELKQIRELAGLSQSQLSLQTGIPRDKLSRVECGYVRLDPTDHLRIEKALAEAIAERQAHLRRAAISREAAVTA